MEIKFRAWSNKYQKMFRVSEICIDRDGYVHGLVDAETKNEFQPTQEEFETNPYVWVGRVDFIKSTDGRVSGINQNPDDEPFILMQFTGLYDKNGKEIYEGDILNLKTSKHNGSFFDLEIETIYKQSVIEWWQSHSNIGYRLRDAKGKTMMVKPSSLNTMEAEVIGNIYEHKHLLEVES